MISEEGEERAARLSKCRVAQRKEKLMNETEEENAERLKKQAGKTKQKIINK